MLTALVSIAQVDLFARFEWWQTFVNCVEQILFNPIECRHTRLLEDAQMMAELCNLSFEPMLEILLFDAFRILDDRLARVAQQTAEQRLIRPFLLELMRLCHRDGDE